MLSSSLGAKIHEAFMSVVDNTYFLCGFSDLLVLLLISFRWLMQAMRVVEHFHVQHAISNVKNDHI